MNIPLTPQQLQALSAQEGELPRLIDPRDNTPYVLLRELEYEAVREIIEDERQQRGLRAVALRNAAGRAD
jgi:hypothetical protein